MPIHFYYPIFALLMLSLMLLLVPRHVVKKLLWISMVWGTGVDLLLILVFATWLKLYRYVHTVPFDFYGVPIWISLAWSVAVVLFLHFLPESKSKIPFYLYLCSFSLLSVFIGESFVQLGMIKEFFWDELLRFPVTFGWFYAIAWNYQYLKAKDEYLFKP